MKTAKKLPLHIKEKIRKIPRKKYHKIIHVIRKRYHISRKTSYYMKEYGPKSHVVSEIIKDSLSILLLTSVVSSLGGIGLQSIKDHLFTIIPFLILIPTLNDMVGDFGTIISSRFTTALYLGKVDPKRWWKSWEVRDLFRVCLIVALIMVVYISLMTNLLAILKGFAFSFTIFLKTLFVTAVTTVILFGIIFLTAVFGGIKIFNRRDDPNNFLIPIATSVADLGTLLILTSLITLLF